MMRIGFDVTPMLTPQSGVGTYTINLLDHLQGLSGGDELVPLAHRPLALGNGFDAAAVRSSWQRMAVNKTFWMQALLPFQLHNLGLNVCHFTNSVASLWTPCPAVVTIHDMTLWLYPQYHYRTRLLAMRPLIPLAARRAAAIIAVSHSAKQDIVRLLRVPAHKVHVVHEAAPPAFRPVPADSPHLQAVRRHYQLPERFLLHTGTLEPRKNLVRLLTAFAHLKAGGAIDQQLVFVGRRGWREMAIFEAVERLHLTDSVLFLGHIPTSDLVAVYNLADLLVFPSLYEGFGLPILEAMACATPVITSPNGSLAEVAGDAAVFIDPEDVDSIADGLASLLADGDRRAQLRAQGLQRASSFTWRGAALRTRQVYGQVLAGAAEPSAPAHQRP